MRQVGFFIFFLFFVHVSVFSQENERGYMFRLSLKDKGNPPYSIAEPEDFLSQKAIDRRMKQGLSVDSADLPIDPAYLSAIRKKGAEIKVISRWLNTVMIYLADSAMIEPVRELPFVNSADWVWVGESLSGDDKLKSVKNKAGAGNTTSFDASYYGSAYDQIHMNKGDLLHEAGFRGEGMTIAVIDASFTNVDKIGF
ncbi:MAG: serine protease, partial [Dysgonamonadaceae bacterium]|nr:serine protease [Dysgonamonadaceae bacterium]